MGPEASTATVSRLPTTYTCSKRFSGLHPLLESPNLESGAPGPRRSLLPSDWRAAGDRKGDDAVAPGRWVWRRAGRSDCPRRALAWLPLSESGSVASPCAAAGRACFPREAGPRCGAARMLVLMPKQVFERDPDVLAGGEGSARREFSADACVLGLAGRIGRCGVSCRRVPDRHGGYGAREGCDDQRGGAAPDRRFGGHHEHHAEH